MAFAERFVRLKIISSVERHLFFEGIFLKYGYDFRSYAEASLDRRLQNLLQTYKFESPLELLKVILSDSAEFKKVLSRLTINTTEFFRDPEFYKLLRTQVFPVLKTYPQLTIWSAGCSSGEEVISLAIALKEEKLLSRTTIYATDVSSAVLDRARDGIYDSGAIQQFTKNYTLAGGTGTPSDYYLADYGLVKFNKDLLENIVFSEHNLATDSVFLEAQLILCRNVMIYFNRELQDRALKLFAQSLVHKGYLCIGPKETLKFSAVDKFFDEIPGRERIYVFNTRASNNILRSHTSTKHE